MRMVCPACSAAYEVPDSLLTPGRVVRCARCANQWVPVAAPPPVPLEPLPTGVPASRPQPWPDAEVIEKVEVAPTAPAYPETPRFTAMDRLALHRASVGENPLPLRIAWAASIVVLLLLAVGAYVFRAEIVHVWPASARLFDALGVMQSPPGKP